MALRALVCGSRDWGDATRIRVALGALRIVYGAEHVTVIHGAASRRVRGVEQSADMIADVAARRLGFAVERFPADWTAEPRRAGILRNLVMLDTRPDVVLAFQRNGSRGTQHTIDEARQRGIAVEVFTA